MKNGKRRATPRTQNAARANAPAPIEAHHSSWSIGRRPMRRNSPHGSHCVKFGVLLATRNPRYLLSHGQHGYGLSARPATVVAARARSAKANMRTRCFIGTTFLPEVPANGWYTKTPALGHPFLCFWESELSSTAIRIWHSVG